MHEHNQCPQCGAALPKNATEGLCPKCLMLAGLDSGGAFAEQPAGFDKTVLTPPSGGFVPPALDELTPHFPQLELLELLGHGGMGAVYKARQTKLDRLVALKIIKPDTADDPTFAERFMREARTLARLSHSNIVAIHDFGEANVLLGDGGSAEDQPQPLYYFIMEYVDGANLRQLLESNELKSDQVLAVVPQICEALQFAHDEGVVHRDIKPENILVDTKGRVKIADFGLARLVASSPQDFTLTGTHQVMGTPRYMAPEQMAGSHNVDHRADIYSLGVVFYEMLTGEVPMGQFEPPSKKAAVDGRLDEVVLRALAREPERRFQQASEMKSSVELISSHAHAGDPAPASPEAVEPPRPAGISTIAEREIQYAWRWIAGESGETAEQRPILPALLMIVLSIAGCLMLLLPWMDLTIDQETVVRDVSVQLENAVSRTLYGSDVWPGIATSVAFGVLALLLITTHSKQRITLWRAAVMTGIAAFAVLHTFLFRIDLESGSYPLAIAGAREDVSMPAEITDFSASSASMNSLIIEGAPLSAIDHRITYQQGFYGSLGLSLGLLLLSAVGVRHAIAHRAESIRNASKAKSGEPATITDIQRLVRGPGIALIVMGLLLVLPSLLLLTNGFDMLSGHSDSRVDAVGLLILFILATLFVVTLVRGGWHLLTLDNYRPALLASCLGQPVGLWGLMVLSRPGVKEAFAVGVRASSLTEGLADDGDVVEARETFGQAGGSVGDRPRVGVGDRPQLVGDSVGLQPAVFPDLDLRRIEMQLKGPAGGLIVVAILAVVFWCAWGAFMIYDEYRHRGPGPPTPVDIGVVVGGGIILLLLVGGTIRGALKMRRIASYEWCMAASILAMIPWSGTVYLLSLPIGIWAFRTLRRPDVRDAFIARAIENERAVSRSQPRETVGDDSVNVKWLWAWWVFCVLVFVVLPTVFALWYGLSRDRQPAKSTSFVYYRITPEGQTVRNTDLDKKLGLNESQTMAFDRVLRDTFDEYQRLLTEHQSASVDEQNRLVIRTTTPFPDELKSLDNRMWTELDAFLDVRQQGLCRKHFSLDREFREGREESVVRIWKVGAWYHWQTHGGGSSSEERGPQLPEKYRKIWNSKFAQPATKGEEPKS